MDRADKEILANILTVISIGLMTIILIASFITWSFSWFAFRMFVLGAVLYLAAYYIHKTIEE